MGKFVPVFTDLEMAVTKILNERTAMGLKAAILRDTTMSVSEDVYTRHVVIGDSVGLHTLHQFCHQTRSGEIDGFGLSVNCVGVYDIRKYMRYLEGEEK
ncbi:hypothetical protein [Brevibacillus fortis]|uniref:Uncharacterized protein n=1 Tax=Brevibacillus fortis TaxID=2126352 RepID=A0A2P7V3R5_9BACL|nr:hypothetical protein [Brevibacillus fortis]PSJ93884.1 hypothetical protein C7R93_17025 [Brevibacillus fortis]